MSRRLGLGLTVVLLLSSANYFGPAARGQAAAKWAGKGRHRILVRVEPLKLEGRSSDEGVAQLKIDASGWKSELAGSRVNLNSVQVIKYSLSTGTPEPYQSDVNRFSEYDRPFRFYDQSMQDDFTTYVGYISEDSLAGRPLRKSSMPFGHRFFNPSVPGGSGKLVWNHTQVENNPSHYAIYFDLFEPGEEPVSPPAGWIGDGGNRIVKESVQSGPVGNVRGGAVDWNNDGLIDVLYGTASGNLVVLQNTGTRELPEFKIRKLLYDVEGQPIDVGFDASPRVTDWNGDGKKDVLVGANRGCIVYFENVGTDARPLLKFSGFVQADKKMLETPNWPIAELEGLAEPGGVYKKDYSPTPFAVDWDNDGDLDLLVGGFVTGLVYVYENVGRKPDNTPLLTFRGPFESEGKPIDVGWGASPVAVDLDSDGDLDLVIGAKAQTAKGGDVADPERILFYYENTGSREKPQLKQRTFPKNGQLPTGVTVMTSVVDFNDDKLLDLVLVVHSTRQTFVLKNIGTSVRPMFDVNAVPLTGYWNAEQLPQAEWPGARALDVIGIKHEVAHGDANAETAFYDFDGDGDLDYIASTHGGHVWFHENRGSNSKPTWDKVGYRMQLENGQPIKVGLPEGARPAVFDFTVLQGARPKLALDDFNGDGLTDLIIGDTFGKVRYYENLGKRERSRFAEPVIIFEHFSRLQVRTADWNSDRRPDVFVITGAKVQLLENENIKGATRFKPARDMNLPVSTGNFTTIAVVDFNQDGDLDLIYNTSHRMTCWVEGTFLRNGYQSAQVLFHDQR